MKTSKTTGLKHGELCERAAQWLRGTKRCSPVLSGIASTAEVPDAIGWCAKGSIVVECKTSLADFRADAHKYVLWKLPGWVGDGIRANGRRRQLKQAGYERVDVDPPKMGTYRYFLCEPGVIDVEALRSRADHGLLYLGRFVKVIIEAPRRENVALHAEIRCLRFGLVHLAENLLRLGCSVDLTEATKRFGTAGVGLPKAERA